MAMAWGSCLLLLELKPCTVPRCQAECNRPGVCCEPVSPSRMLKRSANLRRSLFGLDGLSGFSDERNDPNQPYKQNKPDQPSPVSLVPQSRSPILWRILLQRESDLTGCSRMEILRLGRRSVVALGPVLSDHSQFAQHGKPISEDTKF
jgi:hypothetical protein